MLAVLKFERLTFIDPVGMIKEVEDALRDCAKSARLYNNGQSTEKPTCVIRIILGENAQQNLIDEFKRVPRAVFSARVPQIVEELRNGNFKEYLDQSVSSRSKKQYIRIDWSPVKDAQAIVLQAPLETDLAAFQNSDSWFFLRASLSDQDFDDLLAEDGLKFDSDRGRLRRTKRIKPVGSKEEAFPIYMNWRINIDEPYTLRDKWDEAERIATEAKRREAERERQLMEQAAQTLRNRDDYLRTEELRSVGKIYPVSRSRKQRPEPEPEEPPEPSKPKITTRKLEM